MRKILLRHRKKYTREEENYIRAHYGEKSVAEVAKHLGRTISSIRYKRWKLRLPPIKDAGEYISKTYVMNILSVSCSTLAIWESKGYIKFIRDKNKFGNMAMIELSAFVKFLKNNQDIWDSRRVELYALGEEPDWLTKKRKDDANKTYDTNKFGKSFSQYEDLQLKSMLKAKIPRSEIAKMLGRTEHSIRCRIYTMKRQGDPFIKDICIKKKKWSTEEEGNLVKMYKDNLSYSEIADILNRTKNSVENKVKLLKKAGVIDGCS